MSKSFVERSIEAFEKNKDLSGLDAIIEGVSFYMDQFVGIANEADEADMGLVVYAMNSVCQALRNGMPGAAEGETLVSAMLSSTVITIPIGKEREDEEI